MIWGQLAIKALVSGVLIAAASELARRSPAWGGLVVSLPLTTLLAVMWLWRDTGDAERSASFLIGTCLYVVASLPALLVMAVLLRKGSGFPLSLSAGLIVGAVGYVMLMWTGKRFGLPV